MSVETNLLIEAIARNYQFYLFLFSTFVICMGAARWWGKQFSHEWEKTRRKKANLPVASLTSLGGSLDQPFTYSSLFNAGLFGIFMMLWLLMYVVIMEGGILVMNLIDHKDFSQVEFLNNISISMSFPVFMLLFSCLLLPFADISQKTVEQNWYSKFIAVLAEHKMILVIVIFCWAVSQASMAFFKLEGAQGIALQLVITFILSLCLSYIMGAREGRKVADPTVNNPLVKLEVVHGENLDRAWLYERTDSDYRLVTESGLNHIVPAANVKRILGPIELESEVIPSICGKGNI